MKQMGLRSMVVLIELVLLLLLLSTMMMVAADDDDDDDAMSINCFAEPIGIGECRLNPNATAADPTAIATYFTARFGIPNNKNKNGNGTTTAAGDSGAVPRVKYCLYGWQVIENEPGSLPGVTSYLYSKLNSSELTASDPNCTNDCSAVVSSQMGMIFTEPTTSTIRHRFYTLVVLEGEEEDDAATITDNWNPFPMNPSENLPPKSGTLRVTADGCTYDEWDPVPTSTPTITPAPTSDPPPPPPLDSSNGGGVATTVCWMWLTAAALWPFVYHRVIH
jgi:hypothetical protein